MQRGTGAPLSTGYHAGQSRCCPSGPCLMGMCWSGIPLVRGEPNCLRQLQGPNREGDVDPFVPIAGVQLFHVLVANSELAGKLLYRYLDREVRARLYAYKAQLDILNAGTEPLNRQDRR